MSFTTMPILPHDTVLHAILVGNNLLGGAHGKKNNFESLVLKEVSEDEAKVLTTWPHGDVQVCQTKLAKMMDAIGDLKVSSLST